MVATQGIEDELRHWGVTNVGRWGRGVDTELFRPTPNARSLFGEDERPVFLYVGRVAVEKNIGAFLDLDLPGRKVVVGGGPQMDELKRRYPTVTFTGPKFGEELARHYAAADVFVFPSLTDTFGLVVLEALACGTPVAAYPVAGPRDVIGDARWVCCTKIFGRRRWRHWKSHAIIAATSDWRITGIRALTSFSPISRPLKPMPISPACRQSASPDREARPLLNRDACGFFAV